MTAPAAGRASERAEAERLFAAFLATGAVPVEADILQPAGTLLDLYGEDIRAREYLQVGFELFDRTAPEVADAEVFALFATALDGLPLRPVTGDIGILMAAVRGLQTTDRRKAALLRHVWRPQRFRRLLDRFAGRAAADPARAALLDRLRSARAPALVEQAGPVIGLRAGAEIVARAEALLDDASTPSLAAPEAAMLYDLLTLEAPSVAALAHLRGITPLLPAIAPAVDRFARRLDAMQARGADVASLRFEASHGRTAMEYYDGFVFSFLPDDPSLPPVASGGRYDALTRVLGQGRSIPAVGGVIRPALTAGMRT